MFRFARPAPRRTQRKPRRKSAVRNPIGRDLKRVRPPRSPAAFIPAALALLLAAFALTSLRTEVLKLRYELHDQLEREQELRATRGELTVQMRALREPRQLAKRAAELGFELPQRVIDLSGSSAPIAANDASESSEVARHSEPDGAFSERLAGAPGDVRP